MNEQNSDVSIPVLMSPHKVGTRVTAFSTFKQEESMDARTIEIIGEGVFEGFFEYGDTETLAPITKQQDKILAFAKTGKPASPRIRLDNGVVLWGGEVHWDSVSQVAKLCDVYSLTVVYCDDAAKYAEKQKQLTLDIEIYQNLLDNEVTVLNTKLPIGIS